LALGKTTPKITSLANPAPPNAKAQMNFGEFPTRLAEFSHLCFQSNMRSVAEIGWRSGALIAQFGFYCQIEYDRTA
jgi:hypothetical protein